ncbi:ferritin-like domain-containing protein [Nonomuraea candida]|uniref:ferritin-like domain-containing protein n=1 Tax=Nonomuraea candida TaxID=359159 RepID=UPI001FDEC64E|nr:ferritin-like domain-containing protein [Nonomuraea candida]
MSGAEAAGPGGVAAGGARATGPRGVAVNGAGAAGPGGVVRGARGAGTADPGDLEKLRKALAAEHAALFAYGLLGARTSGEVRAKMTAAFESHRARRDQLRTRITALGGKPAEPDASYALPFFPSGTALAVKLAVHLESGVAAAYLELAAARDPELRRQAALAMQEAVTRSYSFRPDPPAAFPGMPPAPASPPPSPPPSAGQMGN